MKFNCEKALIQEAVFTAARAVPLKSTIPALEGLLLEAGPNSTVFITGFDQKTGIRSSFPADITEEGSLVLPARLFGEIIRKMPDDTVLFQEERKMVHLSCGMSEFDLMGLDPEDYPELPNVDYQNSLTLPQETLKSMISQTIFAVSQDETKPIHTGALFSVEDETLTIVAVDGFRLALRKEPVEEQKGQFDFVVPGASLAEVERICREIPDPVSIHQGSRHILFRMGDTILISRRLEGQFLAWKQAIPRNNPIKLNIDRRQLLICIERVSLIVSEKLKSPLRCVMGQDSVDITTRTAVGNAHDCCPAAGDGGGLEIGFNNRFMMDALRAAPCDQVILELSTPITPCIIVPADGEENFLFMILPVRLRSDFS